MANSILLNLNFIFYSVRSFTDVRYYSADIRYYSADVRYYSTDVQYYSTCLTSPCTDAS